MQYGCHLASVFREETHISSLYRHSSGRAAMLLVQKDVDFYFGKHFLSPCRQWCQWLHPGTRRSEHITPVLARLHWLKIAERIEYKVALLMFKALTTGKPEYLSDLLQLCAPVRQLRSSDRKNRLPQ